MRADQVSPEWRRSWRVLAAVISATEATGRPAAAVEPAPFTVKGDLAITTSASHVAFRSLTCLFTCLLGGCAPWDSNPEPAD